MFSDDPVIRDLEIMAGAVNYRKWIYSRFDKYLGQRVIEIGAGTGNFTEFFLDREIVVPLDNYEPCVAYMKRRFSGRENVIPLKMDISSPEALTLSRYRPDTVVCINVLEHVSDDAAAISNISKVLEKGGMFILLAPAFQFLYGSIDRLVGHYRRYNKRELKGKLTEAGFNIKEIFYMNSVALFGWFLNNCILKRREESLKQVLFFDRFIVPGLKNMEGVVRPPLDCHWLPSGKEEIKMQSEKSWLSTYTLIIFLFLTSVFLLALCKVEDTDAWMHLSFGRLIWELKGLPSNELFVYTSLDKPFSYSSWLFGLIYYTAYHAFNIYGVTLLKAITITTAFYILIKDSLRPYKNHIVSIMVMTAVVLMSRHRFVERPDTFLMVFLSFSIFSLNAFVYDNKKYIYALPLTHMLWANSHSSINLMFVPFLSFIVGGLLQRYLNRIVHSSHELSASQLKTIALLFLPLLPHRL